MYNEPSPQTSSSSLDSLILAIIFFAALLLSIGCACIASIVRGRKACVKGHGSRKSSVESVGATEVTEGESNVGVALQDEQGSGRSSSIIELDDLVMQARASARRRSDDEGGSTRSPMSTGAMDLRTTFLAWSPLNSNPPTPRSSPTKPANTWQTPSTWRAPASPKLVASPGLRIGVLPDALYCEQDPSRPDSILHVEDQAEAGDIGIAK